MHALREGQTLTRYRIESRLGAGAMADVYLATHLDLGVQRAIKVLKRSDGDVRERLLREGKLQANLLHPNVVPVLEVIRVDGHPALIMDFVDGPSLDRVLKGGPLSFDQIDCVARDILEGMVAAHKRGVIHRDLKPSNVLIDAQLEPPVARVADFGMAKGLSGHETALGKTASNVMLGTPYYMAPEQFRDAKSVDERADVWSLGVMLYEMVTGQLPFGGDSAWEVFRTVDGGQFAAVHDLNPRVPTRMAAAIEWALDPALEDRCPTVETLLRTWEGDVARRPSVTWDLSALRPDPQALEKHEDGSLAPGGTVELQDGMTWAPAGSGPSPPTAGSTDPAAPVDSVTAQQLQQAQRRIMLLATVAVTASVLAVLLTVLSVWVLPSWLATGDGGSGEPTAEEPGSPAEAVPVVAEADTDDPGPQPPGEDEPPAPVSAEPPAAASVPPAQPATLPEPPGSAEPDPPAASSTSTATTASATTSTRPASSLPPAEPGTEEVAPEPPAAPKVEVKWTVPRQNPLPTRLRALTGASAGAIVYPSAKIEVGVTYAIEAQFEREPPWEDAGVTLTPRAGNTPSVFCNEGTWTCEVH